MATDLYLVAVLWLKKMERRVSWRDMEIAFSMCPTHLEFLAVKDAGPFECCLKSTLVLVWVGKDIIHRLSLNVVDEFCMHVSGKVFFYAVGMIFCSWGPASHSRCLISMKPHWFPCSAGTHSSCSSADHRSLLSHSFLLHSCQRLSSRLKEGGVLWYLLQAFQSAWCAPYILCDYQLPE